MTDIPSLLDTLSDGSSPDPAATARAWLADAAQGFDGARGHASVAVLNPLDGSVLATVPRASPHDVDQAVASARAGLAEWSALPGVGRARHLQAVAAAMRRRARLFAELLSLETGRPLRVVTPGEVERAIRHIEAAALVTLGTAAVARPAGVVAAILSTDAPLETFARAAATALAAGCAMVAKASERAPFAVLALAACGRDAGLPTGLVAVLCGDGSTGDALARHADVAAVSFTGSAATGFAVRDAVVGSGRPLALALRSAPVAVIHSDADLDAAVDGAAEAFSTGIGMRMVVQEGVAERYYAKLRRRLSNLRVGDPLDPTTDVGPASSPDRVETARALVAQARNDGSATFGIIVPDPARFIAPTLVTDVSPGSALAEAGSLGPIATSTTFRTPDEAIAIANHGRFGGAASVWSETLGVALDTAARIAAGTVWVNAFGLDDPAVPASGVEDGGFDFGDGLRDGSPGTPQDPILPPSDLRSVSAAARAAVDKAVAVAEKAAAWAHVKPRDRALPLMRLADAIEADATAPDAEDVAAAVRLAAGAAAAAARARGETYGLRPGLVALVLREPFGIMGLICPAEPGLTDILSMLLPAIAAGNRVVAAVPASAAAVATLRRALAAAGLPPGVVEILADDATDLGTALAGDPAVAAIWCAGSSEVCGAIARTPSPTLKPMRFDRGSVDRPIDGRSVWDHDLRRATRPKTIWIPYGA